MKDLSLLQARGIAHGFHLLSRFTSFQTGGEALFAFPESPDELSSLAGTLARHGLPFLVLGKGSNVLAPDEGTDAVILSTKNLQTMGFSQGLLSAQCGVLLESLCAFAAEQGLGGLEFACGIPGTVGGALHMNAGAYDGEMSQVVRSSRAFDWQNSAEVILPAEAHGFGYRSSVFQSRPLLLLEAVFALSPRPRGDIEASMAELQRQRAEKQPLEYPSAGSTFKRPPGHFAGKLIADAGLQGLAEGGAEVSLKHAGFIVNRGGATTGDILRLIARIQAEVFARFGVRLQPEVRLLQKNGNLL